MKKTWKDGLTTIFPRQRHYATDPANLAVYPPADITIERIGDPANADLTTLFGNGTAGDA
ncbi:hypothetical protein [Paraburkholderia fungorum]|uniref:hypothetical protein n=1 Tax=Paraburkholderia fungorum TaxID=134537 RepID=UPI0038BDD8EA